MQVSTSIASTLVLGTLLTGCSLTGSPLPPGRPVRDVYEEGSGSPRPILRIEEAPRPGAFEKTRPVIYPPKVFAVYVPEHTDRERDIKIGAHWVYIKVRESSWFQEPIDREPLCHGEAHATELHALRRRMAGTRFGRLLLPHRPAGPPPAIEAAEDPRPQPPFRGGNR